MYSIARASGVAGFFNSVSFERPFAGEVRKIVNQ